ILLSQAVQRQALTNPGSSPAVLGASIGHTLWLGSTLQRLQAWVTQSPQDAAAWQQMAGVARASQQGLRALRAEAEVQAAHLEYPGALDRLKAAQDLVRQTGSAMQARDYIEASIIDTRQRQLEALAKEVSREQALQR
ncbi:MAG: hypothetical protein RLZZ401_926, partial [Pseudomonadota bacterium]